MCQACLDCYCIAAIAAFVFPHDVIRGFINVENIYRASFDVVGSYSC